MEDLSILDMGLFVKWNLDENREKFKNLPQILVGFRFGICNLVKGIGNLGFYVLWGVHAM